MDKEMSQKVMNRLASSIRLLEGFQKWGIELRSISSVTSDERAKDRITAVADELASASHDFTKVEHEAIYTMLIAAGMPEPEEKNVITTLCKKGCD